MVNIKHGINLWHYDRGSLTYFPLSVSEISLVFARKRSVFDRVVELSVLDRVLGEHIREHLLGVSVLELTDLASIQSILH